MSNKTTTKARQNHVSPGIYSREIEVPYSVKSLGITKLGLVGETLRGRAFEPYDVADWTEFKEQFGGLSAAKFNASQYPKYELPYIAKSYLEESNQLSVCRVLGLSGYNAGPAWLITASSDLSPYKRVVAVLRSRGDYKKSVMFNKNASTKEACTCQYTAYDTLFYTVGEKTNNVVSCNGVTTYDENAVVICPYESIDNFGNECEGYLINSVEEGFNINSNNSGQFSISGYTNGNEAETYKYAVSLNPGDKNYILNVFGTTPETGDAPLFVEALYDVSLAEEIASGNVTKIDGKLTFVNVNYTPEYCGTKLVYDYLTSGEETLTRNMTGMRFVCGYSDFGEGNVVKVHPYDYTANKPFVAVKKEVPLVASATTYTCKVLDKELVFDYNGDFVSGSTGCLDFLPAGVLSGDIKVNVTNSVMELRKPTVGQIYTVKQFTDNKGKRNYYYGYYPEKVVRTELADGNGGFVEDIVPILDKLIVNPSSSESTTNYNPFKRVLALLSDGYYYRLSTDSKSVIRVSLDLNNYKSAFRHAMTPWFVSQIKGDAKNIDLTKLFRFHTINDGTEANFEIKVSIANVRPDEGTFDVYIRDINDTDASPVILEKYAGCNLVPGDKNYLGYKIGTVDDEFVLNSKYVAVEIAKGDAVKTSVPCGFVGYPTNIYSGSQAVGEDINYDIISPDVAYNTIYDSSVKPRKQYFGISDRVGIDFDLYTFKGKNVYDDNDITYLGNGFHLDCRLNDASYEYGKEPKITVDGIEGYVFKTVDINSRTSELNGAPIISTEVNMEGSIYEKVENRKFTAYFCGAFDGWDIYRDARTNTDEYTLENYKGVISVSNGEGKTFERIQNGDAIGLDGPGITSDYYAYLAAYRKYANPEDPEVNIFATPGIDYVNNTELVKQVIDMVENEKKDAIYVVTTPDKPWGASDSVSDMYTPSEAVDNLEETGIDTTYACTYYPWVKFHDTTNNVYINLPVTKDMVRNMAMTDNVAFPWFAPAGTARGNVECEKAHIATKLDQEDTLYNGYINPVKTFAADGIKIWGQKTMKVADDDTMLTRVAIRRLLIRLQKLVKNSCIGLIFDPNDPTTENKFRSAVEPILANIQSNRGISDYRLEIVKNANATTTDRREINGRILIKPYQALEWINIDYVLTPEGVNFEDI